MFNTDRLEKVLVTCAPGLSKYVANEIRGIGLKPEKVEETSVETSSDWAGIMELNLKLRCAFAVLVLAGHFKARNTRHFYNNINEMPWEDYISADEYLTIDARIDNPTINNSMFANMKAKDAIVDRISEKVGSRPDSGPKRDNVVISIYWQGSDCRVYINTSGRKLADRGYRKMPGKAPMQETLAVAVLMETGYDGSQPIVCPMCGSGTFAIEAAMIAQDRAPGLLRSNFGMLHLKDFDTELWHEVRNKVRKQGGKKTQNPIIATDIDDKMVYAARQNARTAGVEQLIEFDTCDFAKTRVPEEAGVVIVNPEYGLRLGESKELAGTYGRIGDFFKSDCQGYRGYIFTGNLNLAKKVGLRTSRRIPFYNARIECRLLEYELYRGSKKSKYIKDGEAEG